MPGDAAHDVRWKAIPMLAGLSQEIAEWSLRERPAHDEKPVGTVAVATVAPDFDWRRHGVLWGVTFRRYLPRKPLEMRHVTNQTTGIEVDVPPPSIIPERKVGGRVPVEGGVLADDLAAAMKEAKRLCEETVQAGRPS